MLQGQDFAVDRLHAVQRLLKIESRLGPIGRPGCNLRAQELGRQRSGIRDGQTAAVQRQLARAPGPWSS